MEMIFRTLVLAVVAIVIFMLLPVYSQYRKHKAPLKEVDPNVHYTLTHHLKIVTIPVIRYRMQAKLKHPKHEQPTQTPKL